MTGARRRAAQGARLNPDECAERVASAQVDTAHATRLANTVLIAPQGTVISAVLETASTPTCRASCAPWSAAVAQRLRRLDRGDPPRLQADRQYKKRRLAGRVAGVRDLVATHHPRRCLDQPGQK